MTPSQFKKYRELEKRVDARRKQLISITPIETNAIESSKIISKKLKQEFPEWYMPSKTREKI